MKRVFLLGAMLLASSVLVLAVLNSDQTPQISAELVGLQASPSIEGFARADRPREFRFPEDHGPHPEYQTEWWYYTGNLDAPDGRQFGYQLTFFRRAITPTAGTRDSDWGTNQIYFAHFALTDVKNNKHQSSERFSRGAAGLAGATGNPFRVWLEKWNSTSLNADASRVQLRADDGGRSISLTLASLKPPVLHGQGGLSQKSAQAGNASYYISFTRLETAGTLTIDGETIAVKGLSWMDHEFSTAVLGPNAVGWDWFSIQLTDQRELMLFQIRQQDGSIEPLSSGTVVDPDGSTRTLGRDQFNIRVLSTWKSARSGATYPASWNVSVPSEDLQLTLRPLIADQEMLVSIVYWEGAVGVTGQSHGAGVNGRGFVEMTGYAAARK